MFERMSAMTQTTSRPLQGLTLLAAYGDITYLVIFASLMIFLAFRPQGLMGKPWG